MAEKNKSEKTAPRTKQASKKQTVRERSQATTTKSRRLNTGASKLRSKAKSVSKFGKREYHIPLPDNKVGRILKKRVKVRIIPKFFRQSWAEIRQVQWPNRRETRRLTIAVLIFSFIFGVSVSLLDVGLDKLFKEVIIKK